MKLAIFGALVLVITFFMRGKAVPMMFAIGASCIAAGLLG